MRQLQLLASNYIPGIHPGMEDLLLWADGGLIARVERHLARCSRCRDQALLLRAASRSAKRTGTGDATDLHLRQVFENLQQQIQTWCGPSPAPRIAAALAFYFGDEAARRLDLIPATKPLFSAFLGKRAADALAHKLADAAW